MASLKNFGIPANLIIDYLALVGDTSDNIPGVRKSAKNSGKMAAAIPDLR